MREGSFKFSVRGLICFVVIIGLMARTKSAAATSRPTTQPVTAPESSPQAVKLLQKVQAKYAVMKTYSDEGQAVSDIDLSKVDFKKIPNLTTRKQKMIEESSLLKNAKKKVYDFSMKLGRPDCYLIEWKQTMGGNIVPLDGAVWSAGEGDFVQTRSQSAPRKMKDRFSALRNAGNVSGRATMTIPFIFFNETSMPLVTMKSLAMEKEERLDGDLCYVISGRAGGHKTFLWISKKTLLIRQKRFLFGGESAIKKTPITPESVKKTLKAMGQEPTTQAVERMKTNMELANMLSTSVKGSIIETHRNIVVDAPISKKQFKFKVPATQTSPAKK
ncbi:MAG: hypothetical protein WC975_02550 [Phycisphaerae bacterium]